MSFKIRFCYTCHSVPSTFIDYIDTINIKMAIKSYHNLSINHFTFYNTRHLAIAPPFIALHATALLQSAAASDLNKTSNQKDCNDDMAIT